MQNASFFRAIAPRALVVACAFAVAAAMPGRAEAQYSAPPLSGLAIGERYHVEIGGTLWKPALAGSVSSQEFGLPGTVLDFTTDLGFEQTRFNDLRVVLRPARKHRFRAQYTPISYLGDSVLQRTITFRGITFDAALPVSSQFDWKILRVGYEYDFIYRNRGFVGVLVDVRYTQFLASLEAPGRAEFTSAKAPLPALGLVGRAYVLPNVALNFEVSGLKLPRYEDYEANYFDWDIHGTVNITNYAGIQIGWRKVTTFLHVESDEADLDFQGMWFGAALRY